MVIENDSDLQFEFVVALFGNYFGWTPETTLSLSMIQIRSYQDGLMQVLKLQNGGNEEDKFKKEEALTKIRAEVLGSKMKGKLDIKDLARLGA